jgi:signal transduction histidine kinase
MIDALMDYSKVTTAKLQKRNMSMCNAIQGALKNLNSLIERRHAQIELGEMPSVSFDKPHMTRVFQNLIENAIKFNPENKPYVKLTSEKERRQWIFKVKDNGVGIEASQQKDIFNLFTKLEHGEAYPGSGVGLAICERIVAQHGGKIWVNSEPGKGSEFCFSLPAK